MKVKILVGLSAVILLSTDLLAAKVKTDELFAQSVSTLDIEGGKTFMSGRREFIQTWAVPPDGGISTGLGPVFNRLACSSCHAKMGRGRSPNLPNERLASMLVRLSVEGEGEHGSPKPHPAYGLQLNEEGVDGVPGEATASLEWSEKSFTYPDGSVANLRTPKLVLTNLHYGSMENTFTSLRVGQPMVGLGLLEAVSDSTLKEIAKKQKSIGLNGSFNRVWDIDKKEMVNGRFGFKANSPTLRQQIAEAFLGDIGITSPMFSEQQCTPKQVECQKALMAKQSPELTERRLHDVVFFVAHLAPPPQRDTKKSDVKRGKELFVKIGCAECHIPQLQTATHPLYPQTLPAQTISPYTDMLLHDMGEGMSDGRRDFLATPRQWRTAPLWGVGLIPIINGHSQYLHDGRARSLEEAILWHGGESEPMKQKFTKLSKKERQEILAFLNSL